MDLYLKEWREEQQHESESDKQQPLPLFSSEPTTTTTTSTTTNHLSAPFLSPTHPSTFPRMANGSSGYLSVGQRQELEVQALIYKHVLAGASIPPQLQLLFNKTLLLNSSPSPYNYHYSPYYHPSLLQSGGGGGGGYWGRGGMDPEPGRCRRTDGKKWRCSRDVVSGHKYCERHVHRGRNRSRKPVEIPTLAATTLPPPPHGGGDGVGVILKTNINNAAITARSFAPIAGGGSTHFALSGTSPSCDLLHSNHRSSDLIYENKGLFRATQNDLSPDSKSGDRILRHFFDDWPKSVQEHENASSTTNSATGLSISIPENPSSDFSLKLSTGNGEDEEANNLQGGGNYNVEQQERAHLNWGSTWGSNQVGSMGGPLAEALRSSSTSNSSPTSVLHQLQRGSASEASYIST